MDPTIIQQLDFEAKAATPNTPAIRRKLPQSYVILIRNTIEYIQYLEATGDQALADEPTNWVVTDFRAWIRKGKPSGNTSPIPPPATATTTPTTPATNNTDVPYVKNIQDETLMNWNRAKRSTSNYPVLTNDREYTTWYIKMNRQITLDRILRIIDTNFLTVLSYPGLIMNYSSYKLHISHKYLM